jgi:hypothetical protein
MTKHLIFIISIILSYTSVCLSGFLSEEKVAPGVIYYHEYCATGPWHIHILEIDLNSSAISLESVKAKNSLFALEKTSVIARKRSNLNHYIIGALNADFFELDGTSVGAQVINGEMIFEPTNRSVFGMTVNKVPFISILDWSGGFGRSNDQIYEIKGLNQRKDSDGWFLFNSFFTEDTLSEIQGILLQARLISDRFKVNETMEFQVVKVDQFSHPVLKPNEIKEGDVILVGPSSIDFGIEAKDEIQIKLELKPFQSEIYQLVGGLPRLIRDGKISIEWEKENIRKSFSSQRHPRTAVGFTKNNDIVIFFVVDGRQPGYSVGMNLPELATYMCDWGIHQGLNLDGGGSSTMIVRGEAVNQPSDPTGERPVANALLIVNSSGSAESLRLNIIPDKIRIPATSKFQFKFDLQDVNFLPVQDQIDSVKWICPQTLGMIDKSGMFVADSSLSSGYIYAKKGMMIDSARVTIIDSSQISAH